MKLAGLSTKQSPINKTKHHERLLDYKHYPKGSGVFVGSLSDFFIEEADEWRPEIWPLFKARSDIHFYIQTKRIARALEPGILPPDWNRGYDNVFFNATIDDPKSSENRLSALIEVPAVRKVIALTPLTAPMNVEAALKTRQIQQSFTLGEISLGGTKTNNARTNHWEWVKDLHDQFERWETHFDFKSTGTFWMDKDNIEHQINSTLQQCKVAQAADLNVVGKGDYDSVMGPNHEQVITDWYHDPIMRCLPDIGQVFY